VPVFDASGLFGSHKEIGIRHEGQLYRLRITRHGKLILNK
jgi:hemin uptake protein HemP